MGRKTEKIYDPATGAPYQGADANHSVVVHNPQGISIEGLATGTTIAVQYRLHGSGTWITRETVDGAVDTEKLLTFTGFENYVQLVRTGATDPVAYATY